jgi:hypothetical protein
LLYRVRGALSACTLPGGREVWRYPAPTAWRTLKEIAVGGARADRRITAAVNTARRHAWAQVAARHGALPGVRLADRTLDGVTCIRLDATVTFAHSPALGKELAEANFKG